MAGFRTLVFGDVEENMLPFACYGADGVMTPYVQETRTDDDVRSDMYDDMQNGYECDWRAFADRHYMKVFEVGEEYRKNNVFSFLIVDGDKLVKAGRFDNPKSEWDGYRVAPEGNSLHLKNGKKTDQARKGDIDLTAMRSMLFEAELSNIRFLRKLLSDSGLVDDFIRANKGDKESLWMTKAGHDVLQVIDPHRKFDTPAFSMMQDVVMNPEKWQDGLVVGDEQFAYQQSVAVIPCFAMVSAKMWLDRHKLTRFQFDSMQKHLLDTASDNTLLTVLQTHS